MNLKKIFFSALASSCIFALTITSSSCGNSKNQEEQYKIYELAKTSGFNGTYEEWIESIKGADGKDGKPIEVSVENNKIVWRYVGEETWKNIYSINNIIGPKGDKGEDGKDALTIDKIIKTNSSDLIDTYTIYYSDGSTSTFIVTNGKDGEDGKQGIQGLPGKDGVVPTISVNKDGFWVINNVVTTIRAHGIQGETGENGKSAYELYLEDHPDYNGTLEDWIYDLVNGNLGTKIHHTVRFITGTSETIPSQRVEHYEKAKKPVDPTRAGFVFDGWYIDDEKWSFNGYSVTENMVLVARWISLQTDFYYRVMSDGNVAISGYKGTDTSLVIPDTIGGKTVTFIEDNAFSNCTNLTNILIPSSVSKIGENVFSNCNSLVLYCEAPAYPPYWGFPDRPTVWNYGGKHGTTTEGINWALTKDDTITICGMSKNLTDIAIPETIEGYPVTKIGYRAFNGCKSLISIVIPECVNIVEYNAFDYCDSLTIYSEAPFHPSGWESMRWNSSYEPVVWNYGGKHGTTDEGINWALAKDNTITICGLSKKLTDFVIPKIIEGYSVTAICENAFYHCNLNTVIIPNNIIRIDISAFSSIGLTIYCEALSKPSGWDNSWYSYGVAVTWGYKDNQNI